MLPGNNSGLDPTLNPTPQATLKFCAAVILCLWVFPLPFLGLISFLPSRVNSYAPPRRSNHLPEPDGILPRFATDVRPTPLARSFFSDPLRSRPPLDTGSSSLVLPAARYQPVRDSELYLGQLPSPARYHFLPGRGTLGPGSAGFTLIKVPYSPGPCFRTPSSHHSDPRGGLSPPNPASFGPPVKPSVP